MFLKALAERTVGIALVANARVNQEPFRIVL